MSMKSIACTIALVFLSAGLPAAAQQEVEDIAKAAVPSLAVVTGYDKNGTALNQVVGFILGDDRHIVASLAVVARAEVVEIRTSDGRNYYARDLIRTDTDWNVALLRTDEFVAPPGLNLADDGSLDVGSEVVAVGLPVTGSRTVTEGNVVALHPHAGSQDLIQISNEIGSSAIGGPVLNREGQVVGIARQTSRGGRAVSFAVPSRVLGALLATQDEPPERVLSAFSDEVERSRAVLRNLRIGLEQQCETDDLAILDSILINAISSGIDIYNSGDHQGCYLIYEGAGYKALFLLQDRCKPASSFLTRALVEADGTTTSGRYSSVPGNKAWIMRIAFDSLLGDRDERSRAAPEPND